MTPQNATSTQVQRADSKNANPIVGLLVLIAIGAGIWWVYAQNQEREAQRKREIMREVNWVVTSDGVGIYRAHPGQNLDHRIKEINARYQRPIWQSVPEDRSGKGRIVIVP